MINIDISNGTLEILVLQPNAFALIEKDIYQVRELSHADAALLENEKRRLEGRLKGFLSKQWIEEEDFEIGRDINNSSFTVCGGVYSMRILCRDYLSLVCEAMASALPPKRWAFSVAVEIWSDERKQIWPLGLFILCGNRVFVRESPDFEFMRWFSRSKDEA